jgi:Icc-related predicted phosphoesterase
MPLSIYAISDMHGNLPKGDTIPECDVFIIAGDSCPWQTSHDVITQSVWLDRVFKPWINEEINASKVILIGGNHDFIMQDRDFKYWAGQHLWCDYLEDSGTEYKGVKFWGIPWVPDLKDWAFYANSEQLTNSYSRIPLDTDIVISHGPPANINDQDKYNTSIHYGSQEFCDILEQRSKEGATIPVNIHGHVHEGYGYSEKFGTKFYNVSHLNRDYEPVNDIVEIVL